MTIDEAIKILEDYHERLPRGTYDDYLNAIKLGIEAMKFYKDKKQSEVGGSLYRLPGETEK